MEIISSKDIVTIYKKVLLWVINRMQVEGQKISLLLVPGDGERKDTEFYFQAIERTCKFFMVTSRRLGKSELNNLESFEPINLEQHFADKLLHRATPQKIGSKSISAGGLGAVEKFLENFNKGVFQGVIFGQYINNTVKTILQGTNHISARLKKMIDLEASLSPHRGAFLSSEPFYIMSISQLAQGNVTLEYRGCKNQSFVSVVNDFFADCLQHSIFKSQKNKTFASIILYELSQNLNTYNSSSHNALTSPPFEHNSNLWVPPTVLAVIELLRFYEIDPRGMDVCILGRSEIVGKPLACVLTRWDATVTLCHSKTKNIESHVKRADLVISAIGKPHFVQGEWIKKGAIVVDVGTTVVNGKLLGDVDFDAAKYKASKITPVPGGVGPLTNLMLIRNLIQSCQYISNHCATKHKKSL